MLFSFLLATCIGCLVAAQDMISHHELEVIPDHYIVIFHPNYTHSQHWQTIGVNLNNTQRYSHYKNLNGYAAKLDKALLDLVEADPGVEFVEGTYTMRPHFVHDVEPMDSALQAAAAGGHIEVVKLLVENGADVNAGGGYYGSPLQAASAEGHTEVVKLLVENKANVNAVGGEDGSAL